MSAYSEFFLASKRNVVQLDVIKLEHPSFSQTFRFVRNSSLPITTDEGTYTYLPMRLKQKGIKDDLDFGLEITLGDLGDKLANEVYNLEADSNADPDTGYAIKPILTYYQYRSDVLSTPLLGPIPLEMRNFTYSKQGSTFVVSAPQLNIGRTGEVYSLDRFPMLRGFTAFQTYYDETGSDEDLYLIAGNDVQRNQSSTGALSSVYGLAGAASTQVNQSNAGALIIGALLIGSNSTQVNNSSSAELIDAGDFGDSLLYASFNAGNAIDESPNPATATVTGNNIVFTDGLFIETDGGADGYARIVWSGDKFLALASQQFTIEFDIAWTVLPNYTFTEIVGVYNNAGSSVRIGFYANAGHLTFDGGVSDSGISISSGSTRHHIAIVAGGDLNGSVYIDGSRVLTGNLGIMSGSAFTIVAGKPNYTATCNYSIDNVRLRQGAIYSGTTITPPTYP